MHVDLNTDRIGKKIFKQQCLSAEKAEESVQILVQEIAGIRSVKQWAESCYVSRSGLKKRMNKAYGRYPKSILREIRFETICLLITEKGQLAASTEVALESGLGPSSDALYKFLSRNFETTFTDLKSEILIGERSITFEWLNKRDQ
jgi:AraC-like DNA-binding protein